MLLCCGSAGSQDCSGSAEADDKCQAEGAVSATFADEGALGLRFTPDREKGTVSILAVHPGTQAERHPQLAPGLVLRSVAGTAVAGKSFEEALALIKAEGRPLALEFAPAAGAGDVAPQEAPPPPPPQQQQEETAASAEGPRLQLDDLPTPNMTAGEHVVDYAELFTPEQREKLDAELRRAKNTTALVPFVLTVPTIPQKEGINLHRVQLLKQFGTAVSRRWSDNRANLMMRFCIFIVQSEETPPRIDVYTCARCTPNKVCLPRLL
eukprot:COSAG04_NODE_107_length_25959_cov_6.617865_22_plen_266_part_00